jgi:hypothetical protein
LHDKSCEEKGVPVEVVIGVYRTPASRTFVPILVHMF